MLNSNPGPASRERLNLSGDASQAMDRLPALIFLSETFKSIAIGFIVVADTIFNRGRGLKNYIEEGDLDN